MSRSFNGTSSDYLDLSTLSVTAPPFTISVWVKLGALGTASYAFCVGTSGSTDNIRVATLNASNTPGATSRTTASVIAGASASIADTTGWHVLTSVFTSDSSRAAFLDGANKGTNGTANAPTTPNYIILGAAPGVSNRLVNGSKLAHAAIWSSALSDANVLLLATARPCDVSSATLSEYWPLNYNTATEASVGSGANALTVHGTTFSTDDPFPSAAAKTLLIGVG